MQKYLPFLACLVASLSWNLNAETPDLSTPKKAGVAFATAVQSGDVATAKTMATGTDEQWQIIQHLSDFCVATTELGKSMAKKFGPDAKLPEELRASIAADVETADEKVTGDSAVLITKKNPDDKFPMTLKKTGDAWKVDLANLTKDPSSSPEAMKMVEAFAKRFKAVAAKVDHGDYASPDKVMEAISSPTDP